MMHFYTLFILIFGVNAQPQKVINVYNDRGFYAQYVGDGCQESDILDNETIINTYAITEKVAKTYGYMRMVDYRYSKKDQCFRWIIPPKNHTKRDLSKYDESQFYCYTENFTPCDIITRDDM